jgi:hypothetical protein
VNGRRVKRASGEDGAAKTASPESWRLPRRDFVILPLLCLFTVLVLAGAAELASRYFFAESGRESCSTPDPIHGYKIKPNCVSHRKAAEGVDVEMAYNDCGFRTPEPCGTKPAGAIRVAILGASTAQGFKVPYDESFAARASASLTRQCGRPVEFQNLGVAGYKPLDAYLRVDEALAIKPDLVAYVTVPFDMEEMADHQRIANRLHPDLLVQRHTEPVASMPRPLKARLNDVANELVQESRAVLVAQHFLYADRASFIRLQLGLGDKADYLRVPTTPAWETRYSDIELLLGEMAEKVHRAGIPFLLVFGTQHAQAALVNFPDPPPGIDPEAAGRRMGDIAKRHDILFLDTYDAFRKVPSPDALFYPADGHMTPDGHAVFARALVGRLTKGDIGVFAHCAQPAQVSR